ncbi:MAG: PPOX class F420-dependent oxidoreductase [Acidimicrobiales bacterium]|nr:PPOX class F420-dependent oxidoreductase [Acidimicrobiia bacterium]NNC79371.1 PPOX class F420-dependent oxidoreductase [Acidimicrobiales bacterium]
MTIPESHADLLERAAYWHVATIGPDGAPQSSPVWCGTDDDGHVVFSMLTRRQKFRNLEANPAIALSAIDPDNSYRNLEIRGTVVAMDPDPDHSLIHVMAKKYLGVDVYPWGKADDERVIVRVRPEHTASMG